MTNSAYRNFDSANTNDITAPEETRQNDNDLTPQQ